MKLNFNNKYNTISLYAFLTGAAIILFYFFISQVNIFTDKFDYIVGVMQPFIIGFCIAYIVNFLYMFFKNKFFEISFIKKLKLKKVKGYSILLSYITFFLIIAIFIKFVFPQVMESILGLVNDIPKYIYNTNKFLNEILSNFEIDQIYAQAILEKFNEIINYVITFLTNLIPALGAYIARVLSGIWNVILGLIVSIYLLIDKDKLCALSKKITYGILNERTSKSVIHLMQKCNYTFGKFLIGKIIDSAIIGVLTFIILSITKMPYAILVSVIVGITNVIPFFGPFIGAVPSFFIILFVSPIKALWFLLIIFIIQQIDGNFIGPKILGDSIGISAFWVLFSILVAGNLLGVAGMIIGVPLFAVMYSIIKNIIEDRLRKKGLETETEAYSIDK